MSPSLNGGYEDEREDEREALAIWEESERRRLKRQQALEQEGGHGQDGR